MRFVWMSSIKENTATHVPRYEFYLYKKTKIVPKPIPRYDCTCGKYAGTLLNRVPRYDPRSGANPYPELRIITWNIVFEKKK